MNSETRDAWITAAQLIGNLGFPIFVAVYLLVRVDSLLRHIHTALTSLLDEVRRARQ